MLPRVLEPEVMDSQAEAVDYDQMDHSHVNRVFAEDFLAAINDRHHRATVPLQVFDAGTGTAQIPIELIQQGLSAVITGSDLAEEMLKVARGNVTRHGFQDRIRLVYSDCKRLPDADCSYDAVISNSIVHHIPEPRQVFAELWRILKPGGMLFVRDLSRPDDLDSLERIVQTYAGQANQHQQQMFRDSLHAALTLAEVRGLVQELGLPHNVVQATSDRHWTIKCRKSA